MVSNEPAQPRIDPDAVYSPRQLARAWGTGPQTVYRPIKDGKLRAAILNDRGDLRIRGAWAIDYLESRARLRADDNPQQPVQNKSLNRG